MRFTGSLVEGRLLRRYQRFLADVEFADGSRATAHCPNTGSMLGCQVPGSRVWLSHSARPGRRYPQTWELVESGGILVGINTARTNALVREALEAGRISGLEGHGIRRAEVSLPGVAARFDFELSAPDGTPYYLEVKNVTAAVADGRALFPDAVSERATRHARELEALRRRGFGTGILFCVQRADVTSVAPADAIDPAYGRALRAAAAAGVDIYACGADVSPEEVVVVRPIEVCL